MNETELLFMFPATCQFKCKLNVKWRNCIDSTCLHCRILNVSYCCIVWLI